MGEIETVYETFTELVVSKQEEVVSEVQSAREKVIQLVTLLNTRSEALKGVNEAAQSALSEAHAKFQAAQESLIASVSQAEETASQLQQNLENSQTTANDQVFELVQSLETLNQETDSNITSVIDQFSQQRSEFSTQLTTLGEQTVRQQVDQMLEETESQIRSELRQAIEQGLDTLITAITGIDDNMEEANSKMSNGRQVMREAIDQLEPLIDEVRDGVIRAEEMVSSLV